MSARLVLGSITALDERELAAGNLPHLLARSYIPEAHLSGRTSGVSTLARPAKLIMRLGTQDWDAGLGRRISTQDRADKHRAVVAAADDLQAVVAELNAGHHTRVPPQRALLLMDQTRRSKHSTQQQTIGPMTK